MSISIILYKNFIHLDVHECDSDNGGCDQICSDFPGGFKCSCEDGFHLLAEDGRFCEGIIAKCGNYNLLC